MLYALAILLPPVAVLFTGRPFAFLLNLVLCLFGWLPGIIHAVLVVVSHERRQADRRITRAIEDRGPDVFLLPNATNEEIEAAMRVATEVSRRRRLARRNESARRLTLTAVAIVGTPIIAAVLWDAGSRLAVISPASPHSASTGRRSAPRTGSFIGPPEPGSIETLDTPITGLVDLPPPTPAAQPDGHRDPKNRDLAPME